MRKFRTHWLALLGGLLVLGLSVGSAFAARPTGTSADENGPFGLQVSAFVHGLLNGGDEEETPPVDEEQADEDADETQDEEQADEEQADEDAEDEQVDEESASNHGQCVRLVAMSDEVGGPNENHGGAVSEAARVTCREDQQDEASDEDAADQDTTDEEQSGDELTDSEEVAALSEKAQMKADRAAAREERKADRATAKETRKASHATATHGKGHGKGRH